MGGQACKCDDSVADPVPAGEAPRSAFQEEVVAPAAEGGAKEAPPPEQTGAEEQQNKSGSGAPVVNPDGTWTLLFNLEAKHSLGARFAELRTPEPDGSLVATSISERSALFTTTGGYCGLRPGDVVVKVNGEGGSYTKLLELLTAAKAQGGRLEVTLRPRPATFNMELLRKGDEKMGIVVAVHEAIADRVEVRQISDDGAVPAWNEAHWNSQVVSGDWVIAVNGEKAAANDMISNMQACWQKREKLTIQIRSFPRDTERLAAPSAS
eukprot:TRINITY_DN102996_c0_g1_i1.p1 TRINITY_DN102996_c0_g1~~TRINITY_DN102996_c0_g1_i1.p1  ORF type:complete len:266 (+),score=73.69 TRINITY_DN102996_c0_g1_i1:104-901(+)